MEWNRICELIDTRSMNKFKRLEYVDNIYRLRAKNIPTNGLTPNMYPYHTCKGVHNYIFWSNNWETSHDDITILFPDHLDVISYVNDPESRSMPHKPHRNIFLYSNYSPTDQKIINLPPDSKYIFEILNYGKGQYYPYDPLIFQYYDYLTRRNGKGDLIKFKTLVDPWFRY